MNIFKPLLCIVLVERTTLADALLLDRGIDATVMEFNDNGQQRCEITCMSRRVTQGITESLGDHAYGTVTHAGRAGAIRHLYQFCSIFAALTFAELQESLGRSFNLQVLELQARPN